MKEEAKTSSSSSIAASSWFLGVHIGAGNHSSLREKVYCDLMQEALEKGQHFLQSKLESTQNEHVTLAVQIVHEMLTVFERNSLSNAGKGSNLTEKKTVECEASIVCGTNHLIGVCANVQGVAEPSSLAFEILKNAHTNSASKHPFGREPPLVLVGKEARRYARHNGLEVVNSDDEEAFAKYQVTPSTEAFWTKWNDRFETLQKQNQTGCSLLDTVGAICMDPNGNVASGLSSGGIAFKQCGRVGIAGSVRMGCNADSKKGFAVACSGRGEHFLRTNFVSRLSHRLGKKYKQSQTLADEAIRKTFQETTALNGGIPMEGGILFLSAKKIQKATNNGLRKKRKTHNHKNQLEQGRITENETVATEEPTPEQNFIQFGAAFTTSSMGVGYVHSKAPKMYHTEILRAPSSSHCTTRKKGMKKFFFHANHTIL
jgi:taspase (threonine aspartase 1)